MLAILWRRSVSTVTTLEDSVKFLTLSVAALEKQVKAQKPAETEKKPTIPVTYDTKSKTVTLSSNLLVKGWITAEKEREEE